MLSKDIEQDCTLVSKEMYVLQGEYKSQSRMVEVRYGPRKVFIVFFRQRHFEIGMGWSAGNK